jgi:hypothetical protein
MYCAATQIESAWLQTQAVAGISHRCNNKIRAIWQPLEEIFGMPLTITNPRATELLDLFLEALEISTTTRQLVPRKGARMQPPAEGDAEDNEDLNREGTEVGVHISLDTRIERVLNSGHIAAPFVDAMVEHCARRQGAL